MTTDAMGAALPESSPSSAERTGPRTGKALILATKPYEEESLGRSFFELFLTIGVIAAGTVGAIVLENLALRVVCSVVAGLTQFRLFALFHDYIHVAILKKNAFADKLMSVAGFYLLAPRSVWKETHDFHHRNNGKHEYSSIGSYAILTPEKLAKTSEKDRRTYRLSRHPLKVIFGYITVSMKGMCWDAFRRAPKRHWGGPVALVIHFGIFGAFWAAFGPLTAVLAWIVPSAVGLGLATYLFYAQHNFPETVFFDNKEWDYSVAAAEGSSYFVMGPLMNWFTADIGYHHIHHMNHNVPFYRLEEAMRGIPELQNPHRTTWRPKDVLGCLRLAIWDPASKRMVTWQEGVALAEKYKNPQAAQS